MFKVILLKLKIEWEGIKKSISRYSLVGFILVAFSLLLLSVFSVPLWLSSFKVLPGGAPTIFFCYLLSVFFILLCGMMGSFFFFERKSHCKIANKCMLFIMCSYTLRLLWLLIFFGVNSVLLSLICLCGSIIFLFLNVLYTAKINVICSLIEIIMLLESISWVILTLKFILIN